MQARQILAIAFLLLLTPASSPKNSECGPKGQKHYDVYSGQPPDDVMKLEIAWFEKYLKGDALGSAAYSIENKNRDKTRFLQPEFPKRRLTNDL